jgi:hypothetical protein
VPAPPPNPFKTMDVAAILQQHGWIGAQISPEQSAWCERAAAFLGSHVADREGLAELLGLVFHYDAQEILARVDSHAVLSRTAAREVLRQVALALLDGAALTSERFKEIVSFLKENFDFSSREIFQTVRLALAGRSGDGELDRVILLLDEAAALPFAVPVKSARARIVEFCAALD